jgi:hypothetical protein
MSFLRAILIIVVIYFLARLIIRMFFPFLFQGYVNRKMRDYNGKKQHSNKRHKKEGEITIDYLKKKEKKISKDKGDYIDFKEIK